MSISENTNVYILMVTSLKKQLQSSSRIKSARVRRQDRKKKNPLPEPIRMQDLENSARSQTYKNYLLNQNREIQSMNNVAHLP